MTFIKGQSGNPGGRASGKHMSTLLFHKLKEHAKDKEGGYIMDPESKEFKTYGDLVIEKMIQDSIEKGNPHMVKMILSYMDGDPEQYIDITSNGETITNQAQTDILELAKRISAELKQKKT